MLQLKIFSLNKRLRKKVMNGKLAAAKIYEGFVSKATCAFAFISSVLYTFFRTVMLLGWAVKYQKADFTHGELIWKETKY